MLVCFSIVFLWGLSPVVPVLLGPLGLFYGPLPSESQFQLIFEILIGKLRSLQAILTNNVK